MLNISRKRGTILVLTFSLMAPALILLQSGDHGLTGLPLDDAWIHLVYGRSISEKGYLAYNTGVPATGSTSPLWAYFLGVIHVIFKNEFLIILSVKIVGIIFHLVAALVTYRLVSIITASNLVGLLTAIFLAVSPPLSASSLSGMEISLGCATGLIAMLSYIRKRYIIAGVFLGLSGLARPEFATIAAILCFDMLIKIYKKELKLRKLLSLVLPAFIIGALYIGWNLSVDGRPLPATFYVKSMTTGGLSLAKRIIIGLTIITKDAPLAGGFIWLGLLGIVWAGKEKRRIILLFLFSGLAYFLGNLIVIPPWDPNAFYHIRYLIPAIPFVFISLTIGMYCGMVYFIQKADVTRNIAFFSSFKVGYFVAGITVLVLSLYSVTGMIFWKNKYSRDCRNINEVQVELGKRIARVFPKNTKIGTIDAGAIRYFGKRYTIDLTGLNTNYIFRANSADVLLDALVLMPAWIKLPEENKLVIVSSCSTEDYHVTSNPRMNLQIIAVSSSESHNEINDLSMFVLGKKITIYLSSFDKIQIEELIKQLNG